MKKTWRSSKERSILTAPRLDEENMKSQYVAQRESLAFFNYNPKNSSKNNKLDNGGLTKIEKPSFFPHDHSRLFQYVKMRK